MKLLSFRIANQIRIGLLVNNTIVDISEGCYYLFKQNIPSDMIGFLEGGETMMKLAKKLEEYAKKNMKTLGSNSGILYNVDKVEILAPVPRTRQNIICLGLNYVEHVQEVGLALPKYPVFFTKPPNCIIGPDADIIFPKNSIKIDYEAELAFIFGKGGKNISEEEAFKYVAGYTILNDVTARDLQRRHGQWFKGKGLDTFAPVGPYLITKEEVNNPHNLNISLELNGVIMQKSNTRNLIFKIPTLVKYITMDMTVEPGDIVATGTPSGVGYTRKPPIYLKPGDRLEITVEKIGVLKNKIVSSTEPLALF